MTFHGVLERLRRSVIKILILGLGNLLLGDEGAGVHAVRKLMEQGLPPGTEALEVGTAILDALPAIEKADHIIILDAMKADGLPGSVYRIPFDQCRITPSIPSLHGFDLHRVLALSGRTTPQEVMVIGLEPACLDWSMELSAHVAGALPVLLEEVYNQIEKISQLP